MPLQSFGDWLKTRRKGKDLTQAALADRVGCSVDAIRKFEAEARRPSAQMADRLAKVLDVPADQQATFLRFARGEMRSAPAESPEAFPWQATAARARSQLPAPVTALIGRDRELAEVHHQLLSADIRLVTLIGPPGIGKTRLSLQAAQMAQPNFPDGTFFVALAPLADASLIALTMAQALNFAEANRQSAAELLTEGIRDKHMLLVLDNCEHLIEGVAALVSTLLASCPHLRILATSRESLRIPGEWLYAVPAFDLPAELASVQVEGIAKHPALVLFAERARAVRAGFKLTSQNIAAVTAICARLDGLPLVIELMAARMRLMTPEELLDRLTDQFVLTADGMRTASERQKTLQHAIDWSYQLLLPDEQRLFAYLSIFAGSFTLEVVESVIVPASLSKPVADLVASLLDKSLLRLMADVEPEREARFTLLATLREYARQRLRAIGEETTIRNQHLRYCLELAEQASHELRGPSQAQWLRRLASVRDDLRAALDWAINSQQTEAGLRLGSYLSGFWFRRSDLGEGRQWLERVVRLPGSSHYPHWYADALTQLAQLTWLHQGAAQARPFVEQALAVAQYADERSATWAEVILSLVLMYEGDFAGAEAKLTKSESAFRSAHDEWGYADAVLSHALCAFMQHDLARSLALHEEALAIFRQLGDKYFENTALRFIGVIALKQNNPTRGGNALREALRLASEIGSKYEIAAAMIQLGEVALAKGDPAQAVRLYWASKNIFDSIGVWEATDESRLEAALARCRAALNEPRFSTLVAEGRALTIEQAIRAGLTEV